MLCQVRKPRMLVLSYPPSFLGFSFLSVLMFILEGKVSWFREMAPRLASQSSSSDYNPAYPPASSVLDSLTPEQKVDKCTSGLLTFCRPTLSALFSSLVCQKEQTASSSGGCSNNNTLASVLPGKIVIPRKNTRTDRRSPYTGL